MSTSRFRFRMRWHATVCITLTLACTPDNLVAPNGSVVAIAPERTTVAAGGDSVRIIVSVQQQGGLQVDDQTVVYLSTNVGSLHDGSTTERRGLVRLTTRGGLAAAWFIPADVGGSATLTAKSGAASGTVALTIADAVAPDGTTAIWSAQSDTVVQGSTTTVRVYLRTKALAPVPDGTRAVADASIGSATPAISLARSGFLELHFAAPAKSGAAWLRLRSGPFIDSLAIVVR